jgi:hypothetical protein
MMVVVVVVVVRRRMGGRRCLPCCCSYLFGGNLPAAWFECTNRRGAATEARSHGGHGGEQWQTVANNPPLIGHLSIYPSIHLSIHVLWLPLSSDLLFFYLNLAQYPIRTPLADQQMTALRVKSGNGQTTSAPIHRIYPIQLTPTPSTSEHSSWCGWALPRSTYKQQQVIRYPGRWHPVTGSNHSLDGNRSSSCAE